MYIRPGAFTYNNNNNMTALAMYYDGMYQLT